MPLNLHMISPTNNSDSNDMHVSVLTGQLASTPEGGVFPSATPPVSGPHRVAHPASGFCFPPSRGLNRTNTGLCGHVAG